MRKVEATKWVGLTLDPFKNEYTDTFEFIEKNVIEIHEKEKIVTHKKAICSGNVIEVINYEEPLFFGYESQSKGKQATLNKKEVSNINKSKMSLRRLINANVGKSDKFITLTYKNNIDDVKKCKNDFKTFVKNIQNNLKIKPKYVYVVEFQKRGALHFHVIFFDFPYVKKNQLEKWWGHGFVKINKIDNVDNVGAYVCKYMSKDLVDDRLTGSDLYGRSRGNLDKPEVFKKEFEVELLEQLYHDKQVYSKSYNTDYHGNVTYKQYNIKRSTNK